MAMYTMYVSNTPRWSIALPQPHILVDLAYKLSPNAAVGVVTGGWVYDHDVEGGFFLYCIFDQIMIKS